MQSDINALNDQLQAAERELLAISSDYANFAIEAAEKRAHYDVRWAQEILKIKTNKELKLTIPEADAMATTLVQDELVSCRIAEAMASAAKAKLDATKNILSSIQTRAGLLKTESFLTTTH